MSALNMRSDKSTKTAAGAFKARRLARADKTGFRAVTPPAKTKKKASANKSEAVAKIVHDLALSLPVDSKEVPSAVRLMSKELGRRMLGAIMGSNPRTRVRLPLALFDMQSSAGAVITTTYGISAANCAGFNEWQTVFATYRILDAELEYHPYFAGSSTNTGLFAAGFDYGATSTAAGSTSQCLQLSDPKVVPCCRSARWHADFRVGYDDFVEVSSTPYYAYWKSYSTANSGVGVSTYYGALTGWVTVEFEGFI